MENHKLDQNFFLGLESSCDETAASVVAVKEGKDPKILSSVVFEQSMLHSDFGGVVPEIAARAHAERMDICVSKTLEQAARKLSEMSAICVTAGPGLIGGCYQGSCLRRDCHLDLENPLLV